MTETLWVPLGSLWEVFGCLGDLPASGGSGRCIQLDVLLTESCATRCSSYREMRQPREALGRLLGESWEALGRLLGESWEALGRFWEEKRNKKTLPKQEEISSFPFSSSPIYLKKKKLPINRSCGPILIVLST